MNKNKILIAIVIIIIFGTGALVYSLIATPSNNKVEASTIKKQETNTNKKTSVTQLLKDEEQQKQAHKPMTKQFAIIHPGAVVNAYMVDIYNKNQYKCYTGGDIPNKIVDENHIEYIVTVTFINGTIEKMNMKLERDSKSEWKVISYNKI